jgi:hypothetical protein
MQLRQSQVTDRSCKSFGPRTTAGACRIGQDPTPYLNKGGSYAEAGQATRSIACRNIHTNEPFSGIPTTINQLERGARVLPGRQVHAGRSAAGSDYRWNLFINIPSFGSCPRPAAPCVVRAAGFRPNVEFKTVAQQRNSASSASSASGDERNQIA